MKIHIVQKGDTLWNIAKKYGVDFEALKSMNTQLSNPDLIMPGMKIKVPSGNVHVKKDGHMHSGNKKEMPMMDHPFVKEKPKPIEEFEEVAPIQKEMPKPSIPYVPPAPTLQQPIYPEIDVNNYYMVNMAHMTQMPQLPQMPPLPPKMPEQPMKEMPTKELPMKELPMKEMPIKELPMKELPMKEQPAAVLPEHHEEVPQMPMYNAPNIPNVPNAPVMQAPVMQAPLCPPPPCPPAYPPCLVPISPVMPGYGFCYPVFPCHQVPAYGGVPVSPEFYGGAYPYGQMPVAHDPVMGAYDEQMPQSGVPMMEDDYDDGVPMANMPYQQSLAQAGGDCGCGSPTPMPYYGQVPYQQPVGYPQYGFVGQQQYQPFGMPYQQGYPSYGGFQAPQGPMFSRPDLDDDFDD